MNHSEFTLVHWSDAALALARVDFPTFCGHISA